MKKAFYRHNSSYIKLVFSDGETYLQLNTETNKKALINDSYELIMLSN